MIRVESNPLRAYNGAKVGSGLPTGRSLTLWV